jgi:hypothetical protein
VVMLVLFVADGFSQQWVGWGLAFPALFVGLLGGCVPRCAACAVGRALAARAAAVRALPLALMSDGAHRGD